MARKNPKLYQIKWREEDVKLLKETISDFNKRRSKLKKLSTDSSYLPEEVHYRATKDLITNRAEFNRVIKSLQRFKGKEAFKKVELPSGEEITAWERKEIGYQKGTAKRRINKLMEEEESKYNRKTDRYKELEDILKSVENISLKKGTAFKTAKARIKNYGSADYELKRAVIYKENYLSMLKERFENVEGYRSLRKAIKNMNAVEFYERIKLLEQGDKIKDISYMYDTNDYIEALNILYAEFEIDKELNAEDYEYEEGE